MRLNFALELEKYRKENQKIIRKANNAGVQVTKATGEVTIYSTKSEASKALLVSPRTLSRWCSDPM